MGMIPGDPVLFADFMRIPLPGVFFVSLPPRLVGRLIQVVRRQLACLGGPAGVGQATDQPEKHDAATQGQQKMAG